MNNEQVKLKNNLDFYFRDNLDLDIVASIFSNVLLNPGVPVRDASVDSWLVGVCTTFSPTDKSCNKDTHVSRNIVPKLLPIRKALYSSLPRGPLTFLYAVNGPPESPFNKFYIVMIKLFHYSLDKHPSLRESPPLYFQVIFLQNPFSLDQTSC